MCSSISDYSPLLSCWDAGDVVELYGIPDSITAQLRNKGVIVAKKK